VDNVERLASVLQATKALNNTVETIASAVFLFQFGGAIFHQPPIGLKTAFGKGIRSPPPIFKYFKLEQILHARFY
jgi:hypothetical protein